MRCLARQIFHVMFKLPLVAAGQPHISRDNPLMGSKHQHLVFQFRAFACLDIPPLIQIAPVHVGEVSGVIDDNCALTFENISSLSELW